MPSLSLPAEDWGDQKCLTALPYICKRSNGTAAKPSLPPLPAPASGGCPRGWFPFLSKVWRNGEGTATSWSSTGPMEEGWGVLRDGRAERDARVRFGGSAGGARTHAGMPGVVRRGVGVQEGLGGGRQEGCEGEKEHWGRMGLQRVGEWGGCRAWGGGGGGWHPLDSPLPLPVQCFSFNGHDKAEIVKWPEAKQACESQGAVLATIASPLEQGRCPPPAPTGPAGRGPARG